MVWTYSTRRRWLSVIAALHLSVAAGAQAACVDFSGPVDLPRHPSVQQEYESSTFVVIGRVTHTRSIPSPEDPSSYGWMIYDVAIRAVYKGKPPRSIKLTSSNTTARFPMDDGRDYLLFIDQFSEPELAGDEPLPVSVVDNCGQSGEVRERAAQIRAVRRLANKP